MCVDQIKQGEKICCTKNYIHIRHTERKLHVFEREKRRCRVLFKVSYLGGCKTQEMLNQLDTYTGTAQVENMNRTQRNC